MEHIIDPTGNIENFNNYVEIWNYLHKIENINNTIYNEITSPKNGIDIKTAIKETYFELTSKKPIPTKEALISYLLLNYLSKNQIEKESKKEELIEEITSYINDKIIILPTSFAIKYAKDQINKSLNIETFDEQYNMFLDYIHNLINTLNTCIEKIQINTENSKYIRNIENSLYCIIEIEKSTKISGNQMKDKLDFIEITTFILKNIFDTKEKELFSFGERENNYIYNKFQEKTQKELITHAEHYDFAKELENSEINDAEVINYLSSLKTIEFLDEPALTSHLIDVATHKSRTLTRRLEKKEDSK